VSEEKKASRESEAVPLSPLAAMALVLVMAKCLSSANTIGGTRKRNMAE
jgi:hypothetical protein